MGSVVVRRGRCRAEDEEEGRAGGRGVQLRYARGSRASRVCARTSTHPRTGIPEGPVRTLAGLAAWRSLCAAHPADSNSSACAVEMSTVGESQDPPWKDVLYTKGLSAAATILEEYGLSCESDMSLVDEDDLVVLCSKLKPFQSKLLRKWVQGLGAEQRAAAFMKDASAAKNHSTSPPLEDKGEEDEDEEENGDEDADADEDEDSDEEDKEVHGGASGERGAGDGKSDEDVRIIGQQSAQHHKEDGKRAKECVCENDAAAAKKAKTSTLSTEQQSFVSKFNPAPAKIDEERKIATRHVKGRLNSLKKQGARLNDVKGATIAKRLQEFSGN